jgi:hypothetical protein
LFVPSLKRSISLEPDEIKRTVTTREGDLIINPLWTLYSAQGYMSKRPFPTPVLVKFEEDELIDIRSPNPIYEYHTQTGQEQNEKGGWDYATDWEPIDASLFVPKTGQKIVPGLKEEMENLSLFGVDDTGTDRAKNFVFEGKKLKLIIPNMIESEAQRYGDFNDIQGAGGSGQGFTDWMNQQAGVKSFGPKQWELSYIFQNSNESGRDNFELKFESINSSGPPTLIYGGLNKTFINRRAMMVISRVSDSRNMNNAHTLQENYFADLLSNVWNNGSYTRKLPEDCASAGTGGSSTDLDDAVSQAGCSAVNTGFVQEFQGEQTQHVDGTVILRDQIPAEHIDSLYVEIFRDFMTTFSSEIAKSDLFGQEKEVSAFGLGGDTKQILYETPLDLIDFAPRLTKKQIEEGCLDPHLLDLDGIKKLIKNLYDTSKCIENTQPNVDGLGSNRNNPLESSMISGAVLATIRLYAVELILKSIFAFSEFQFTKPGDIDASLISYVRDRILVEIEKRSTNATGYGDNFKIECLKIYNNFADVNPDDSYYRKGGPEGVQEALDYLVRIEIWQVIRKIKIFMGTKEDNTIDSCVIDQMIPIYNVVSGSGEIRFMKGEVESMNQISKYETMLTERGLSKKAVEERESIFGLKASDLAAGTTDIFSDVRVTDGGVVYSDAIRFLERKDFAQTNNALSVQFANLPLPSNMNALWPWWTYPEDKGGTPPSNDPRDEADSRESEYYADLEEGYAREAAAEEQRHHDRDAPSFSKTEMTSRGHGKLAPIINFIQAPTHVPSVVSNEISIDVQQFESSPTGGDSIHHSDLHLKGCQVPEKTSWYPIENPRVPDEIWSRPDNGGLRYLDLWRGDISVEEMDANMTMWELFNNPHVLMPGNAGASFSEMLPDEQGEYSSNSPKATLSKETLIAGGRRGTREWEHYLHQMVELPHKFTTASAPNYGFGSPEHMNFYDKHPFMQEWDFQDATIQELPEQIEKEINYYEQFKSKNDHNLYYFVRRQFEQNRFNWNGIALNFLHNNKSDSLRKKLDRVGEDLTHEKWHDRKLPTAQELKEVLEYLDQSVENNKPQWNINTLRYLVDQVRVRLKVFEADIFDETPKDYHTYILNRPGLLGRTYFADSDVKKYIKYDMKYPTTDWYRQMEHIGPQQRYKFGDSTGRATGGGSTAPESSGDQNKWEVGLRTFPFTAPQGSAPPGHEDHDRDDRFTEIEQDGGHGDLRHEVGTARVWIDHYRGTLFGRGHGAGWFSDGVPNQRIQNNKDYLGFDSTDDEREQHLYWTQTQREAHNRDSRYLPGVEIPEGVPAGTLGRHLDWISVEWLETSPIPFYCRINREGDPVRDCGDPNVNEVTAWAREKVDGGQGPYGSRFAWDFGTEADDPIRVARVSETSEQFMANSALSWESNVSPDDIEFEGRRVTERRPGGTRDDMGLFGTMPDATGTWTRAKKGHWEQDGSGHIPLPGLLPMYPKDSLNTKRYSFRDGEIDGVFGESKSFSEIFLKMLQDYREYDFQGKLSYKPFEGSVDKNSQDRKSGAYLMWPAHSADRNDDQASDVAKMSLAVYEKIWELDFFLSKLTAFMLLSDDFSHYQGDNDYLTFLRKTKETAEYIKERFVLDISTRKEKRKEIVEALGGLRKTRELEGQPLTLFSDNGNIVFEKYVKLKEKDLSSIKNADLKTKVETKLNRDPWLYGKVNFDAFQEWYDKEFGPSSNMSNMPGVEVDDILARSIREEIIPEKDCGENLEANTIIPGELKFSSEDLVLGDIFDDVSVGLRLTVVSAPDSEICNDLGGTEKAGTPTEATIKEKAFLLHEEGNILAEAVANGERERLDFDKTYATFPVVCVEDSLDMEMPVKDLVGFECIGRNDIEADCYGIDDSQSDCFQELTNIESKYIKQQERLRAAMKETEEFKFLFKYVFPVDRMFALNALYILGYLSTSDATNRLFNSTKENLRMIFMAMINSGNYKYTDEIDNKAMSQSDLGTDIGDNNPVGIDLASMAVKFPLMILKALTELTDPNIALAKLITDGANAGINKLEDLGEEYLGTCTDIPDIPILPVSMALLPMNVFPPPPFGPGIGPPLTPLGFAYLTMFGIADPLAPKSEKERKRCQASKREGANRDYTKAADCYKGEEE